MNLRGFVPGHRCSVDGCPMTLCHPLPPLERGRWLCWWHWLVFGLPIVDAPKVAP